MSDKPKFIEEQQLKDVLLDVRSDSSETNWCLFTYDAPKSNNIILAGSGSGGVDELKSFLKDDIVGYGLVRTTERIDETTAVKFAFIMWLGENVGRMQKARISVHKGSMQEFIGQVHVDINASSLDEINVDIINDAIGKASGTKVKVLSDEMAQARISDKGGNTPTQSGQWVPRSSNSATKVAAPPKTVEKSIKFVDEEGLRADIKDVRSDSTDTNWILVGYEGKKGNTLVLLGKGNGGLPELLALLEDDMVGYGLLRKVERIDESDTVKFVFIEWTGENIDRMHKARLSTHKGAVTELFAPYHVDILQASKLGEITEDIIERKIKEASGTINKVKS